MRRKVDREKIERADRESKLVLDAERKAREVKTARLREQRLSSATLGPKAAFASSAKKPARRVSEID